jgi:hypothetical protein
MAYTKNHGMIDPDEHYTPKIVFDCLNLTFGTDVCAPVGGVPWIPAINYYDKQRNGLEMPWFDLVWMNPPFSEPTPWVDKFIEHGNGVALLFVSRSKWFHKLWNASDNLVPMPREWRFARPDGSFKPVSYQCMLFAIGDLGSKALHNIPDYKVR